MQFQIFSDIHLEHLNKKDRKKWLSEIVVGAENAIIAGDFCNMQTMKKCLDEICKRFDRVIYVFGNHEYYGLSPQLLHIKCKELFKNYSNLIWLRNESLDFEGLKIFGGTMWYPEPPFGLPTISDHRKIVDFVPWVYNEHQKFNEALEQNKDADIIITHHLPSHHCISDRFKKDSFTKKYNHYWCVEKEDWIKENKPKLWIYGHTHDRSERTLHQTKLITNPLGYPDEWVLGRYINPCIVEV